ncbi:hypothetical protein LUZ60_005307 [Juncus effusus]|nr:hypothetical protein LUZ60_005307 [Juncus effusus]
MATYYSTQTDQREMQQAAASYPVQNVFNNLLYLNNNNPDSEFQTQPDFEIPDPQAGTQFQFGILNNNPNIPLMQQQGLSLSLNSNINSNMGSNIPAPWFHYCPVVKQDIPLEASRSELNHYNNKDDDYRMKLRASRYLKVAQELLDEVVSVYKGIKQRREKLREENVSNKENDTGSKSDTKSETSTVEISPSEKQELQNKLAKLLTMLDEVDRKYKHYYHQMQIITSTFDLATAPNSSKPYTAVALQTISKHFRCLRDAIADQIRSVRKKLGEDIDNTNLKGGKLTRLRFIDQQLRQQRAFQQFGMMQNNAWRPQRGLPETSVMTLRAWLFEHFLHPYPSDSEKLMLARQTGLTRGQISNWFINARVRLWKPMIEDMYKEEIGEAENDSNSSNSENAPPNKDKIVSTSEEKDDFKAAIADSKQYNSQQVGPSVNDENTLCYNANVVEESFMSLMMKAQPSNDHQRFMGYQGLDLGPQGSQSVSLSLGLQNQNNQINGQTGFLEMHTSDDVYGDYEQQQRLHDFVA